MKLAIFKPAKFYVRAEAAPTRAVLLPLVGVSAGLIHLLVETHIRSAKKKKKKEKNETAARWKTNVDVGSQGTVQTAHPYLDSLAGVVVVVISVRSPHVAAFLGVQGSPAETSAGCGGGR